MTPADLLQILEAITDVAIAELDESYPELTTAEMQLLMELRAKT